MSMRCQAPGRCRFARRRKQPRQLSGYSPPPHLQPAPPWCSCSTTPLHRSLTARSHLQDPRGQPVAAQAACARSLGQAAPGAHVGGDAAQQARARHAHAGCLQRSRGDGVRLRPGQLKQHGARRPREPARCALPARQPLGRSASDGRARGPPPWAPRALWRARLKGRLSRPGPSMTAWRHSSRASGLTVSTARSSCPSHQAVTSASQQSAGGAAAVASSCSTPARPLAAPEQAARNAAAAPSVPLSHRGARRPGRPACHQRAGGAQPERAPACLFPLSLLPVPSCHASPTAALQLTHLQAEHLQRV